MAPVTNAGDVISIPAHTADSESATITFTWSQSLRSRTETYYILKGKNVTQGGGDTLIFIQKDWYAPGGAAENVSHFTKKDCV